MVSVNCHNESTWHYPLRETTVQYKVEGGGSVEEIQASALRPSLHLMPWNTCSAIENMSTPRAVMSKSAGGLWKEASGSRSEWKETSRYLLSGSRQSHSFCGLPGSVVYLSTCCKSCMPHNGRSCGVAKPSLNGLAL